MHPGEFMFYLADIFTIKVQYGGRTDLCKLMNDIAEDEITD